MKGNCIAFKDSFDTVSPFTTTVDKALERIKTGASIDLIKKIRTTTDKAQQDKLKKYLPSFLFSASKVEASEGSFRNNASVKEHSGFLVLDFDDVPDVPRLKEELSNDEYIYAAWVSPRATGIKALIQCTADVSGHKDMFKAIEDRYKNLDTTGRNVARLCYESYDPEIYINPKSKIWSKKAEVEAKAVNVKTAGKVNYKRVGIAMDMISNATEGSRHDTYVHAAYLMGGYIQKGYIDRDKAYSMMMAEIQRCGYDDMRDADKAVSSGLEKGSRNPLSDYDIKQAEEWKPDMGPLYSTLGEIEDKVVDVLTLGYLKGASTGFRTLDDIYSVKPGSTTYIYGPPYVGKSQVWHQVLINLSISYGWKHVIMSPETGDKHEVYAELVSMVAQKNLEHNKFMQEEICAYKDFVDRHFIVIDPEGRDFDIEDFFRQVESIERQFGVKVDTCTIDPFNHLSMDLNKFSGREDKATGKYLDIMLADARKNDRHNCIVTHVRDQQEIRIKGKDGSVVRTYHPISSPRDIAGGQMYYRKGMSMLSVYRPVDTDFKPLDNPRTGEPYAKNQVLVINQKAKPKGTGKRGVANLYYDMGRNCYYELNGLKDRKYPQKI
jgi:hypothetical protein